MKGDTVNDSWDSFNRISDCKHNYDNKLILNVEKCIQETFEGYTCKYNVGVLKGNTTVSHARDPINPRDYMESYDNEKTLSYMDSMGGVKVATRNVSFNDNYMEVIVSNSSIDYELLEYIKSNLNDKYTLEPYELDSECEIIFLPGGNLYDTVDFIKVNDLLSRGNTYIKPHPITTDEDVLKLEQWYGKDMILPKCSSGYNMVLNPKCKVAWISRSSELGIIRTLLTDSEVRFIDSTNKISRMTYTSVYRLFNPWDINYNKEIVERILTNPVSGYIFRECDIEKSIKSMYILIKTQSEVV